MCRRPCVRLPASRPAAWWVSIEPSGPAEHVGLRLGDVLLGIDGQSVVGQNALRAHLGAGRIGSVIELRVMREGTVRHVNLTVASHRPD